MVAEAPTRETADLTEAVNQSGRTPDHDAYGSDATLRSVATAWDLGWASELFGRMGRVAGARETEDLAHAANRHEPELRLYDRFGNRLDEVEYHPAYHRLMELAFGHEVHSLAWTGDGPHPHTARAVLSYLWNQAENGVGCPTAMAYAAVPVFSEASDVLRKRWVPKVTAAGYDPRSIHVDEKAAATIGMSMTEKQGGSDLRKIRSIATPLDDHREPGARYLIHGHKWFTSAPMSDGFFALARTEEGISCFFFERRHADGTRNPMRIQRLKEKLGNRSNASSELEFDGVVAELVGEPGHGIRTILGQGHLTRIDMAINSAGIMRKALTHTLHHTNNRLAFDRPLTELPLMRAVLADLALDVEAATLLVLRMALALDREADDEREAVLARVGVPIAKYLVCRQAPQVVGELLECHGGNGFVEEGPMARLYRETPLNAIWEGSSNVICLDVLRGLARVPHAAEALVAEIGEARGMDHRLDEQIDWLEHCLVGSKDLEPIARMVVERLALVLQARLMAELGTEGATEAFIASRFNGRGRLHGAIEPHPAHATILERAAVA